MNEPDVPGSKKPSKNDTPARTTGAMHENVPDWSDPVCSCEAEPYWEAVAEELENEVSDKKETPNEDRH